MTPLEQAREMWRQAADRFLNLPRGTRWSEVVRVHAIETEAWRILVEAQKSQPKEEAR